MFGLKSLNVLPWLDGAEPISEGENPLRGPVVLLAQSPGFFVPRSKITDAGFRPRNAKTAPDAEKAIPCRLGPGRKVLRFNFYRASRVGRHQ
jgi:hypothetical protein